ncbi:amidohydrolase family protein [Streptomyces sp. NPDC096198]|uniref:amidohydrolase family protein n=1 Tax=Streptomyces sp. NPDC096198 TaxID=3366080 RepID=UPI0037F6F809
MTHTTRTSHWCPRPRESARLLVDLDDERLRARDDTGLDVQVLSLSTPGVQNLERADAVALQTSTNDLLAATVRARPDRFRGFATLATPDPAAAADELRRGVTELGPDGALVFCRTRERTLDHPDFRPIFEAAEALRAPLYLHPQSPPPQVRAAYYHGLGDAADAAFATFGLGWHHDSGVQLLRLILSGVFDRYPGLQVIVGHWGETVLFYLERIEKIPAVAKLDRPLAAYFRQNIHLTPSGMFSGRYLRWAAEVVGADRIMLATDYPFERAPRGGTRRFLQEAELSEADRRRIGSENWNRLCAGIRR